MQKHTARRRVPLAALAASLTLTLIGHSAAPGPAAAHPATAGCEGDACAQVTMTFDEAAGQYRARNNSQDRWARVTASNVASAASACVAPGGEGRLTLRSIVGPYRADYAEAWCGSERPPGAPPGRG